MKILHIKSSPRGQRSISTKLSQAFLEALSSDVVKIEVDELDVWALDLLPFDGPALDAKYADLTGVEMTVEQHAVWQQIDELGWRFRNTDLIVFSVPMWNFGIPYRLKHLIDVVSQRGVLFTFDAEGMRGLLAGKKVVICAARGLALGPDYPAEEYDHQVAYLRTWSRMVGIEDVEVVLSQATLSGEDVAEADFSAAIAQASKIAKALKGS